MPKVSIIIPVYNSEKYISKCLESILNQTYKDYEILIINDGSIDDSQKIINEYQQKYSKIINAIQQENKGVAKTRNEAINIATGEYIMFIDNDDYIDTDYIETHLKYAEQEKADVVISGYRRTNQKGKIIKQMKLKNTLWARLMILAPWAKIYKKDYLVYNDIQFLDNNIGEDVYFNLQAMLISNKIKIIDYIGYNWFFNEESISNTKQKNIMKVNIYNLLNECYNKLKNKKILEKNHEIIEMYFIKYIIWAITFSTKKAKYKTISDEYDKIFNWLQVKFPNYKKNKLIKITKPKGENIGNRLIFFNFMLCHKLHLGKLLIYMYSRI